MLPNIYFFGGDMLPNIYHYIDNYKDVLEINITSCIVTNKKRKKNMHQ
jgi:hypothetical protein